MNFKYSRYFGTNWLIAFMFLGFLALGTACKTSQNLSDNYKPWPNALLWEISGNDLDQPSYVYGTIHLIDKSDFFYPEKLRPKLYASEEIVFEIDIEDMMDLSAQMGMLSKAFMKDNLTIRDLLSDEEYSELKAYFDKLGLPLFFFERLKPMFLTILTSMDGDLENLKNETTSYEFELLALAKEQDKEVDGLETMDFQIGLFDSIPYKEQADMLMESIRTQTGANNQLEELTQIYVDQDIEAMVSTIGDDDQLGKYEKLLVNKR
ncbi:MAG: TraB/GumN family protein, partial [Saprospiraceae bacterium]|nr:TraB/GumN family protein [Saprospiraceae bacterium]